MKITPANPQEQPHHPASHPPDPSKKELLTVTIVGGGSSAHVLIPFLSKAGHVVNLLTRRPESWNKTVSVELHTSQDKVDTIKGCLNKISSDPAVVIPDANAVILCMPVHQYRDALHRLAPFLDQEKEEVFVGTIYGQAGFNWMVHEIEQKFDLHHITAFAVGLIPWICRTIQYGSFGVNYGAKEPNIVAVTPADRFDHLNEILLEDISYNIMGRGKFVQACSFLSLTLSVDNQIIHPSRCYGLWKRYKGHWATVEDVPYFYKDFDEISADVLQRVDADYSKVRDAVRRHFPQRPFHYMLDYMSLEKLTHQSQHKDIQKSFQDSKQLEKIKTPAVQEGEDGPYELDIQCRFFTDDIPYGLLIAKWIALELHVKTPMLDEVIMWAQNLRGEAFLAEDGTIVLDNCLAGLFTSGIPPSYGITSIDDILD